MNLKNLNKKIRRLVAKIEKDTKKLAKLRLRLTSSPKKKQRSSKKKKKVVAARKPEEGHKTKGSTAPAKPATKKRQPMSAARRAQLSAAMNARWAAKRAAANAGSSSPVTSGTAAEMPSH